MEARWTPDFESCAPNEITMSFDNIVSAFVAALFGTTLAVLGGLAEYLVPRKGRKLGVKLKDSFSALFKANEVTRVEKIRYL